MIFESAGEPEWLYRYNNPTWSIPYASPVWQLCPKCNGAGIVYTQWTGSGPFSTTCECDVCNGKKIISVITGLPPQ